MSGQHTYILRLLRQMEAFLAGQGNEVARGVLGKITHKISLAERVDEALETLYAVDGYDEFAVRLLWCLERSGVSAPTLNGRLVDHEVRELATVFIRAMNGRWREASTAMTPATTRPLEAFYEALHKFGRTVQRLKRRAGEGENFRALETDTLYRLLNDCTELGENGAQAGNQEVVRFAAACAHCVQYIMDNDHLRDSRSLNILDSANLTLQTCLEAAGTEEYDSLRHMVLLLEHPEELLQ